MGLSETWLHPNEVHSIKTAMQNHPKFKDIHINFEIFSKPGMVDVESDHLGRPKGGVSLIVKNNQCSSSREIEVLTDRVIAIGLYDKNNSLIQVICSTYMPFYNGKRDQTDLYIETIDALQVLIDQYASIAPIKIIGDLNTPLPLSEKLSKNWYKQSS